MANYYYDGFSFLTKQEASLAETERKKVDYIESHMDYDNPKRVLAIYNKAVSEKVFSGIVGISYLRMVQNYLAKCPEIESEQIQAVPAIAIAKEEKKKPVKKSQALLFSIVLNIALVIAIIAMFAITLNSEYPNIINYEKNLQNKYASWAEELTERENDLRQKELEFKEKTQF